MAYIFISHNLSVIRHISDRVMVMYLGHVVELADKHQLYDNPSHPYTSSAVSNSYAGAPQHQKEDPASGRSSKSRRSAFRLCVPYKMLYGSGICSVQKPELKDIGGGHMCACHFCGGCQK